MISKIFRLALLITAFSVSAQSSAAIISSTANGVTAQALDLNSGFSSFLEFFYNGTNEPATGFESGNEVVMFFGELNDELALFTLISGDIASRGKLNMDFSPLSGFFFEYDDSADFVSINRAEHKTGLNQGDGFIYESDNGVLDLIIDFSGAFNMDTYKFLTFDNNGNSSVLFSGDLNNNPTVAVSGSYAVNVSAPNTMYLMLLSLSLIAFGKRRFI